MSDLASGMGQLAGTKCKAPEGSRQLGLNFVYQPERIRVRFSQNYVENRVLTHCG